MACVIDHLRADYQLRVIQDFTDARGVRHSAGETAILRTQGLDWERQEIWLEWEQKGRRATLYFALGAKTGPRNGAMRDYFEMGDPVATPAPHSAVGPASQPVPTESTTAAAQGPRRPDIALQPYVGRQPPADTKLEELQVACDCDPALHRPVLLEPGERGVAACLGCGTVTCTRSVGDDGRFTGDSWHAYFTVELSGKALAWLAGWPRLKRDSHGNVRWPMSSDWVCHDPHYLPAKTRCGSAAELEELESRTVSEQKPMTHGQRLRQAGFPKASPPRDLPEFLGGYASVWRALHLSAESPVADLIYLAQRRSAASAVAADLLNQRSDREVILVEALRSQDPVWQSAGFAMALAAPPADSQFDEVLLGILNGLSLTPLPDVPGRIVSCNRFEALLVLVAELKLATPAMLAALPALQRRLARHDAYLVRCLQVVIRELRGEPPDPAEAQRQMGFLP